MSASALVIEGTATAAQPLPQKMMQSAATDWYNGDGHDWSDLAGYFDDLALVNN